MTCSGGAGRDRTGGGDRHGGSRLLRAHRGDRLRHRLPEVSRRRRLPARCPFLAGPFLVARPLTTSPLTSPALPDSPVVGLLQRLRRLRLDGRLDRGDERLLVERACLLRPSCRPLAAPAWPLRSSVRTKCRVLHPSTSPSALRQAGAPANAFHVPRDVGERWVFGARWCVCRRPGGPPRTGWRAQPLSGPALIARCGGAPEPPPTGFAPAWQRRAGGITAGTGFVGGTGFGHLAGGTRRRHSGERGQGRRDTRSRPECRGSWPPSAFSSRSTSGSSHATLQPAVDVRPRLTTGPLQPRGHQAFTAGCPCRSLHRKALGPVARRGRPAPACLPLVRACRPRLAPASADRRAPPSHRGSGTLGDPPRRHGQGTARCQTGKETLRRRRRERALVPVHAVPPRRAPGDAARRSANDAPATELRGHAPRRRRRIARHRLLGLQRLGGQPGGRAVGEHLHERRGPARHVARLTGGILRRRHRDGPRPGRSGKTGCDGPTRDEPADRNRHAQGHLQVDVTITMPDVPAVSRPARERRVRDFLRPCSDRTSTRAYRRFAEPQTARPAARSATACGQQGARQAVNTKIQQMQTDEHDHPLPPTRRRSRPPSAIRDRSGTSRPARHPDAISTPWPVHRSTGGPVPGSRLAAQTVKARRPGMPTYLHPVCTWRRWSRAHAWRSVGTAVTAASWGWPVGTLQPADARQLWTSFADAFGGVRPGLLPGPLRLRLFAQRRRQLLLRRPDRPERRRPGRAAKELPAGPYAQVGRLKFTAIQAGPAGEISVDHRRRRRPAHRGHVPRRGEAAGQPVEEFDRVTHARGQDQRRDRRERVVDPHPGRGGQRRGGREAPDRRAVLTEPSAPTLPAPSLRLGRLRRRRRGPDRLPGPGDRRRDHDARGPRPDERLPGWGHWTSRACRPCSWR